MLKVTVYGLHTSEVEQKALAKKEVNKYMELLNVKPTTYEDTVKAHVRLKRNGELLEIQVYNVGSKSMILCINYQFHYAQKLVRKKVINELDTRGY